jgi:branched-subunit amino acid ABC-type transport system permease component
MDSLSAASGVYAVWRTLAKAHAYWFCVTRSTFKALSDDGLEDWKALLVISVAMLFAALAGVATVSIALGHRVLLPDARQPFMMLWGSIVLSLVIMNYVTLIYRRRWSRFERGFRQPSSARWYLGGVAVWLSMILIVAAAEWTSSIARKLPPG